VTFFPSRSLKNTKSLLLSPSSLETQEETRVVCYHSFYTVNLNLTSIYTNFLFQISFMLRNAQIISVPRYSFISSESDLLFSRSSTQTCDPEVNILILLKQTLHRSILWVSCPLFCYFVCLNVFLYRYK
jgi:hypothetical protein